jgi:pyruvate/2-oxoglutarate dehydrogenase complex dihydrolipoamide dehydrogenase (E3) component
MPDEFEVVVIGAGPVGEHFAGKAAATGLSVAIVEAELIGGECSYWACMPSKTLLRPGQVLATAKAVPGVREVVTGPLDVEAALARRNWMVSDWDDHGQVEWLANAGVELVRGHGRLAGARSVDVEAGDGSHRQLHATRAVVVAVGSVTSVPPVDGLRELRYWTNRDITSAQAAPRRLIVLGGGPVGVEMAQAWKRLGSEQVTVIEGGEHLLGRMEPFAGETLLTALRAEGIDVRLGKALARVAREAADAPVIATLADDTQIIGDELLVATGRHPHTDDVGLETVGLEPGRAIEVSDDFVSVGVPEGWLYAIGDTNGRALLTHMGKYQARMVVAQLSGAEYRAEPDGGVVTNVVFTDPQIASVGLTEAEAQRRGLEVRTVRVELTEVAAAAIWGDGITGSCQLVVATNDECIVGATFVGPEVGDMLHAATIAVVGHVPMTRLRHAVAAFPSMNEIWLEMVERYFAP